jgi:hypothetical protein
MITMAKTILTNAFSIQMIYGTLLKDIGDNASVNFKVVSPKDVPASAESFVGHADAANILTGILGRKVAMNRASNKLSHGDVVYVAQFVGGRLPEGATTLPEGCSLEFIKVSIK